MTNANASPITDANISPSDGANISHRSMPADSMAEIRELRRRGQTLPSREFRYTDGVRLRDAGWPTAIAAATAAVVLVWSLGRWASQTSVLDKFVDAATPPASDEKRAEARRQAQAIASPGDWLSIILDHHRDIEAAFAATKAAVGPSRIAEMKKLRSVLSGHSIAEEAVIYPAMSEAGERGHASHAFNEQALAKTQMAKLEKIDPAKPDFVAKLEEIRAAVSHHMYEEEATWFPMLKKLTPSGDQSVLTTRFLEEFHRYTGPRVE